MKNLFFNLKDTLLKASVYAICGLSLIGLSSCGDDNDDDNGLDNSTGTTPTSGLVSNTVPSSGWNGSTENGITTYRSSENNPEDDGFASYYAFAFKDGKCTDGVFNIVCENEAMATQLANMLKDGSWADYDGDDEDEYYTARVKGRQDNVLMTQALHRAKAIKKIARISRAIDIMGITCTQDGKIVYFKIDAIKGLDGETVKYVVNSWDTGLTMDNLPDKPIFGTWDDAAGKYTTTSIYALPNSKIEVLAGFNDSNIVNKYEVIYTLPNALWADSLEEALIQQAEGLQALSGIQVEVSRNGNIIRINEPNIEIANVAKENLLKMIIALDILNAQPIGTMMF